MYGHRSLGIGTEEYFIHMGMKGTTCTFTITCSMDDIFQQCCQILLINENHWDPFGKKFHISMIGEYGKYIVGREPAPSRHMCSFNLNSNELLMPVAEP